LSLTLAPGQSVSSASYVITGPGGFSKAGTIDVSQSATLSATIAAIPAGVGFSIMVTATTSDGSISCAGSAIFNVTARMTTAVVVHLVCHEAPRNGSVQVTGTINVCPVLDSVSAVPAEVFVGGSLALAASAHDADHGPS